MLAPPPPITQRLPKSVRAQLVGRARGAEHAVYALSTLLDDQGVEQLAAYSRGILDELRLLTKRLTDIRLNEEPAKEGA